MNPETSGGSRVERWRARDDRAGCSRLGSLVIDAIDLHRLPWIRPLVAAYLNDFPSVSDLFAGNPADPAAWSSTIARVASAPRPRAAVAAALARQLEQRQAPAEARAAAAALAADGAVAVVSGQQAGVFGGPLYTLFKAVTAIKLAQQVKARHTAPVVALFWVDAEDHDWKEIATAHVLDDELSVRHIQVADVAGAGARPAGALRFDGRIDQAVLDLESALPSSEFRAEVLASVRRRFCPGAGVASAFAGFLDDLLGRHGLVVFESSDPHLKPLVADMFALELEQPGLTGRLARDAAGRMSRLGHQPQVEPAEDSVALFYVDGQGRRPIKRRETAFLVGDHERPAGDLRAEAARHPERFSPSVLLRPLIQDRLFPTVCYVAGPSELAYQAQLGGAYRAFGVEPPLIYPRGSATIVDSSAARFFEKSGVPLEALQPQDEGALNRLLESQLPPAIEQTFADTDRDVTERAARLKAAVVPVDPTLAGAVDTTLDKIRETLKTLQSKIIQASKRKDDTLRRQFHRTRALTFPEGQPQERLLCTVFFLNKYGPALTERLLESLPLDSKKHYLLKV
jgi:bacillithiol biosynthesis cysteine-adding enzyme BshC